MKRYYEILLRSAVVLLAALALFLLGATLTQGQNQTLQGNVQQNQSAPFVNIIEAGSNVNAVATRDGKIFCDWMQGACNMLSAYVAQGGSRSDCLDPLKTGVEFEREERSLTGPQSNTLDNEKADLESQRDKALAKLPSDCFSGGGRPNIPQDSTIPDYPILRKVRPKPVPTPPYVRPDGSFGATTGGLVTDTNSCVQGCVSRLHQRENDCAARTTRAYGVNAKTMADYQTCMQPAMEAFYSEYRQCYPQNQNQPSHPIAPSNTAAKPFACQAYWNDWYVKAVGRCGRNQACISNTNATVQSGLASCGQGQPQSQPEPNPKLDWVHDYTAPGAAPPLRYNVGFNQGVSRCLQDQITMQNLAAALWSSAWGPARVILGVAAVPGFIDAVVHPPGFSVNPDPYTRGKEEGARICNWLLQITGPFGARAHAGEPLVPKSGEISIPPDFSFPDALKSFPEWGPEINPTNCNLNCGPSSINLIRVLFGKALEAAPNTTKGMTDAQMEAEIGRKFSGTPLTDIDVYQLFDKMPDGTVGVISGENPTYKGTGTPPPGPITDWNLIPGHFFGVAKLGEVHFLDGQSGNWQTQLPGNWTFRWMIVGNTMHQ